MLIRIGLQLGEVENNGSHTFQGWPDQLSMMKDQLIEMIRGYERAGFQDMKQLGSALSEPKFLNQILKDLALISSISLAQLRDQVQTMKTSQIEALHELFGEELPSQGVKPKGPIELDAVLNHNQDVNLVVKVT